MMQKPVKLKITGQTRDVRALLQELEGYFTTTRTSEIIEHREGDGEAHVYVLVLPEGR